MYRICIVQNCNVLFYMLLLTRIRVIVVQVTGFSTPVFLWVSGYLRLGLASLTGRDPVTGTWDWNALQDRCSSYPHVLATLLGRPAAAGGAGIPPRSLAGIPPRRPGHWGLEIQVLQASSVAPGDSESELAPRLTAALPLSCSPVPKRITIRNHDHLPCPLSPSSSLSIQY